MADLSKIKLNGVEYDLKDSFAREAIANIPEDKIFPVNVTLTSITEGTSDKSHTEILAAVNAGKIPFVYIDYSGIKMIAPLTRIESNYSVFTYEDQSAENLNYACLKIQNSTATIIWRDGYITQDDLPTLSSVATSGDYNDLTNKPTIPAAQVNADWDATSGVAQILHKPTIPTIPTNVSAFTNDSGYLTSYTETDPTVPAWAKAESKPTYTAQEVGALPDDTIIPTVPTNISAFTNDAGYLTSYTETDPTVPAWAKASAKPTYTASEVGAMATTHAANSITSSDISNWNSKTSNTGTVTSVRVQATAPVQSSVNTAQSTTLNTTISLASGYGDTQNPYASKTANYVLASPNGSNGTPSFRKLVATDLPSIGNITNAGDITTTATIASGDRLIINDESASKIINSSITFGSSTAQYLANNGTWQNTYDDSALAARVTALEQLEWATYYSGRSNPSNSQGQNGDIYLQY